MPRRSFWVGEPRRLALGTGGNTNAAVEDGMHPTVRVLVRGSVLVASVAILVGGYSSVAMSDDHAFVGSKKCKMCHIKEWKSWSQTKMASAFDGLKPGERKEAKLAAGLDPDKDYTKDEACVRCHVTGHGVAAELLGPKYDMTDGVTCESCHGAGGDYYKKKCI